MPSLIAQSACIVLHEQQQQERTAEGLLHFQPPECLGYGRPCHQYVHSGTILAFRAAY